MSWIGNLTDHSRLSQGHRSPIVLLTALLILAADLLVAQSPDRLVYRGSNPVYDEDTGLREPSGLSLSVTSGDFWTVSDNSSHLFHINTNGLVTSRGQPIQGLVDPEGIVQSGPDQLFALSEEGASIFVVQTNAARAVSEHALLDMQGANALLDALGGNPERLSPEGLAVDTSSGTVFIANERHPRLLIKVSPDLDAIVGVTRLTEDLGFASPVASERHLDISGLVWDAQRNGIWLSSDTGECLFFWDMTDQPARRFDLLWLRDGGIQPVDNAEGIALGSDGQTLFVITDDGKHSMLHEFEIH